MIFSKKQNNKNNSLIKFIVILIVFSIATFSVMTIIFFKISANTKVVSSLTNDLEIEIKKEQNLAVMKSLLSEIEDDRKKLNTYFVSEDSIVNLLQSIEATGGGRGISVVVNSVSESSDNEGLKIQITMEGSFRDIWGTLFLIEALPFKISFDNVFIEKDKEKDIWDGRFFLTVLSYISKE